MYADQEGVVHDLEALQYTTITLHRFYQSRVRVRFQKYPLVVMLHEVEILVGR